MHTRQPLYHFLELGFYLGKLDWVGHMSSSTVRLRLKEFAALLKYHFPQYSSFQRSIEIFNEDLGFPGRQMDEDFPLRLQKFLADFFKVILHRYGKTIMLPLESHKIISELSEFAQAQRDEELYRIGSEASLCLETGAYRAAVVLVWSLTLDFLRKWIIKGKKKRLQPFNAALVPLGYKNPVLQYGDFDHISDTKLIQAAYDANLIRKHQYTTLKTSLDERNQFAHPSGKAGSQEGAYGYIHNLILNVLNHKHFQRRSKKT